MSKVLDFGCQVQYCKHSRCRNPRSKLCEEHIIFEVLKMVQSRGNYNIDSRDVLAAIDGATGESATAIRKLVSAVVKLEDKIIESLRWTV